MRNNKDILLRRIQWISMIIFFLIMLWHLMPFVDRFLVSMTTEPRSITARGELAANELNTIQIFEQASPSVVFINTRQQVVDFWTRNVFNVDRGTGTGFVWDELGHVVTNNHVIDKASEAIVRLNDGRSYNALLVGSSTEHDLAVLRINVPINLPSPFPIGTSYDLKVGQKVLAIGNPFGLDYSLTTGVVSALNRSIEEDNGNSIDQLIQTDAAINPGNSGGPLLDSAGRLVGINTAIFSPSGAYAGIGFAVPVDTINRVVPQLIASGTYIRPSLGIGVDQDINEQVLSQLDLEGILILRVEPDSAAQRAGLLAAQIARNGELIPGDIILSLNGEKIINVDHLLSALEHYQQGQEISLRVWREGDTLETRITLQ